MTIILCFQVLLEICGNLFYALLLPPRLCLDIHSRWEFEKMCYCKSHFLYIGKKLLKNYLQSRNSKLEIDINFLYLGWKNVGTKVEKLTGGQPQTWFFHLNSNLELAQKLELQIKDALRSLIITKFEFPRGSPTNFTWLERSSRVSTSQSHGSQGRQLPHNFAFLTDENFPFLIPSFSRKTKFPSKMPILGWFFLRPGQLARNEGNFTLKSRAAYNDHSPRPQRRTT